MSKHCYTLLLLLELQVRDNKGNCFMVIFSYYQQIGTVYYECQKIDSYLCLQRFRYISFFFFQCVHDLIKSYHPTALILRFFLLSNFTSTCYSRVPHEFQLSLFRFLGRWLCQAHFGLDLFMMGIMSLKC